MSPADDLDPFEYLTRPPANESPEQRQARERKEANAKKISDQIDEELKKEKAAFRKQQAAVKVLLLGQSESGKSTTLKNFRMRYAQQEWETELQSWRTVVQLNLIRSVTTILDAIQAEMDNIPSDAPATPTTPSATLRFNRAGNDDTDNESESEYLVYDDKSKTPTITSIPITPTPASPTVPSSPYSPRRPSVSGVYKGLQSKGSSTSLRRDAARNNVLNVNVGAASSNVEDLPASPTTPTSRQPLLTSHHHLLKLRLAPLRTVEKELRKRLGASAEDETPDGAIVGDEGDGVLGVGSVRSRSGSVTAEGPIRTSLRRRTTTNTKEFTVRRLKDVLHPLRTQDLNKRDRAQDESEPDSPTDVISNCKDDIRSLWVDEIIRTVLKKRKIRLEDSAGFFLDDLDRIASPAYVPSSDDVVRARLRTLGVQEYRIKVDQKSPGSNILAGALGSTEWLLYDVGGSRTLRHAWLPYFENINAIIFLAPVSCFDERLLEDSRINRLEDSFLLWRTICSSKLLTGTSLILFMNKCDLLKRKLKNGVRVKTYLPSFGDRPNDAGTVVKYLKEKFRDIVKTNAPEGGRVAYYYATSVTDTKTTFVTLQAVKDVILRDHLKSADFV
ncbi:G-alpha-domain-containing protein [Coprinopsis marcescibilis]|uniref:G-alpha-domain-containing protein n=1 Tax=Coprinopsis marcescibilis TaxID=230819 RepID=A0A5C3KM39_COPMA|nr:G-alpha-domain-containing protein [Coprinopsis marcescibilis]